MEFWSGSCDVSICLYQKSCFTIAFLISRPLNQNSFSKSESFKVINSLIQTADDQNDDISWQFISDRSFYLYQNGQYWLTCYMGIFHDHQVPFELRVFLERTCSCQVIDLYLAQNASGPASSSIWRVLLNLEYFSSAISNSIKRF